VSFLRTVNSIDLSKTVTAAAVAAAKLRPILRTFRRKPKETFLPKADEKNHEMKHNWQ